MIQRMRGWLIHCLLSGSGLLIVANILPVIQVAIGPISHGRDGGGSTYVDKSHRVALDIPAWVAAEVRE
jgi:hypothetical protein